jgi:hypothetical protein
MLVLTVIVLIAMIKVIVRMIARVHPKRCTTKTAGEKVDSHEWE